MRITAKTKKNLTILFVLLAIVFLFSLSQIYLPKSLFSRETIIYNAKKGMGDEDIARELKKIGLIKNPFFFELYVVFSGRHGKIQAGRYELSSLMSAANIVEKLVLGEVVKERITILEGWSLENIASHLESKNLYKKEDFLVTATQDYSTNFEFLKDKPKDLSLEGYIFPDTYDISYGEKPEDLIKKALSNFEEKLTSQIESQIILQNKSVFEAVAMASILEKEVSSLRDKKIVSGILWKRIKKGMPLQVDATVNYVTGKNDSKAAIKDTKIDSPYNTYKYSGLPLGPISNPGINSIIAAVYPEESPYWYYLSADGNGQTIFSRTLDEHNAARTKYFK